VGFRLVDICANFQCHHRWLLRVDEKGAVNCSLLLSMRSSATVPYLESSRCWTHGNFAVAIRFANSSSRLNSYRKRGKKHKVTGLCVLRDVEWLCVPLRLFRS
jgi:hypothetical protein